MGTRMRTALMSLVGFVVVACGSSPAGTPSNTPHGTPVTAAQDPPSLDCGPEIRGTAALTGPGSVLLVGEMHGTTQVPALVGRIVCHAASAPQADVLLGLEMGIDTQPAVDAYLASDGGEAATAALLVAPHFASETKDGRSSQAMLQLIASVRGWRSAGAPLRIVCFDPDPRVATTAAERDAAMAKTLTAVHQEHPGATLVTLSGNVHNRTVAGVPWDATFVPMGAHLRETFPKLVSLDFRSAGGTFWACMGAPGGESRCGVAKGEGEDRGSEPFAELHASRDEGGFDGVLYVGTTTASEPAVSIPAKP